MRSSAFFRALSRSPPPNALMMAVCAQKRGAALGAVFEGFTRQLADDEAEAWARTPTSLEAHERAVQALVAELLPHGDLLYITYGV